MSVSGCHFPECLILRYECSLIKKILTCFILFFVDLHTWPCPWNLTSVTLTSNNLISDTRSCDLDHGPLNFTIMILALTFSNSDLIVGDLDLYFQPWPWQSWRLTPFSKSGMIKFNVISTVDLDLLVMTWTSNPILHENSN